MALQTIGNFLGKILLLVNIRQNIIFVNLLPNEVPYAEVSDIIFTESPLNVLLKLSNEIYMVALSAAER